MRGQSLRAFLTIFLSLWNCIAMASNTMRAVLYEQGGPEKMTIGVVPRPKTGPNLLLIRVFYTALNRADTIQRKGGYPPPPGESDILGLEAAGIVEEVGPSCNLIKGFTKDVLPHFSNGKLKPIIDTVYPSRGSDDYVKWRSRLSTLSNPASAGT